VGRESKEVQVHHAPLRKLFLLKYFLCHYTCCFEFQGKFIATYKYSGYYYGLGRDTVESIAREGLATCVHLEIEVRITYCLFSNESFCENCPGEELMQFDGGLFHLPRHSHLVTQETSRGLLPSLRLLLIRLN